MIAKRVFENIGFKRGEEPRKALDLGMSEKEAIQDAYGKLLPLDDIDAQNIKIDISPPDSISNDDKDLFKITIRIEAKNKDGYKQGDHYALIYQKNQGYKLYSYGGSGKWPINNTDLKGIINFIITISFGSVNKYKKYLNDKRKDLDSLEGVLDHLK